MKTCLLCGKPNKIGILHDECEEHLQELRFLITPDEWAFFAELSAGKMRRKKRDKWFLANESRPAWYIAQGILADIYGEDPP